MRIRPSNTIFSQSFATYSVIGSGCSAKAKRREKEEEREFERKEGEEGGHYILFEGGRGREGGGGF